VSILRGVDGLFAFGVVFKMVDRWSWECMLHDGHVDVFCDASGYAVYTFNTIAFEFDVCYRRWR